MKITSAATISGQIVGEIFFSPHVEIEVLFESEPCPHPAPGFPFVANGRNWVVKDYQPERRAMVAVSFDQANAQQL